MADATTQTAATPLTIPDDVRAKFPEVIDLIIHSESMVDSERQYWINILPVMNEEQLKSLRDILENEKVQLAAIDAKYAGMSAPEEQKRDVQEIGAERSNRASKRANEEQEIRSKEEEHAESLLSQIDQQTL